MERTLRQEYLTLAEAAGLLTEIAGQLADGTLAAQGPEIRVAGPVTLSVELNASHTSATATIVVQCHRRDGDGSRLLREELARPGG